jgi:XrtN system VIT domain protein
MEFVEKYNATKDFRFKLGLSLITLALTLYYCMNLQDDNALEAVVFANYGIAVFYLFIIHTGDSDNTGRFFRKAEPSHYIFFLTLASISCFTLNETINVFDNFSVWVDAYILIMYGGLIATCLFHKLPYWTRIPIFFTLGLGTAMSTYFTVYLLPLMPFGVLLSFVLGLSLHLIVPLLVLINFISTFVKAEKTDHEKLAYGVGLAAPIVMAILFVAQWQNTTNLIQSTYSQDKASSKHSLPSWVALSQQLSDGFFTQRIIKGEMVYTTFGSSGWGSWNGLGNSLQEKKEHDPLVAIATSVCGKLPRQLSTADRLQLLKFYGNMRHDTHRKLWRGGDLSTTNVKTKIQVYPEYRMAYTEKIITIKNNHRWRAEEALYTFQLPEGSVATSLSLWVNGIEEQSRLTTRGKADSAYVEIVDVEPQAIRDPALLHWQEGNTISITVFPCTPQEDRVFKVGITSPMELYDGELQLPEISFEGPSTSKAERSNQVEFPTQPNTQYDIDYYGKLTCAAPPLSLQHFSFKNQTFWMEDYQPKMNYFKPSFIYLDINKSWSSNEFEEICALYSDQHILVYYNQDIKEINAKSTAIFEDLAKSNFSLFPTDIITNPSQSLLISKSTDKSPNLNDLKNTSFGKTMIKTISSKSEPLNLYSLSYKLSPYLQSLEEFYVFNYEKGSLAKLKRLAKNNQFPSSSISKNSIILHQANTVLYRQADKQVFESKAPDHLMRLFSYNQILKKIGPGYFKSGYENEDLIRIASEANVVSPISSLIVLETKKDYERFDIKENKDGLGNASDKGLKNAVKNNSGAVPEPHEWLFFILSIIGLMFLQFRKFR